MNSFLNALRSGLGGIANGRNGLAEGLIKNLRDTTGTQETVKPQNTESSDIVIPKSPSFRYSQPSQRDVFYDAVRELDVDDRGKRTIWNTFLYDGQQLEDDNARRDFVNQLKTDKTFRENYLNSLKNEYMRGDLYMFDPDSPGIRKRINEMFRSSAGAGIERSA